MPATHETHVIGGSGFGAAICTKRGQVPAFAFDDKANVTLLVKGWFAPSAIRPLNSVAGEKSIARTLLDHYVVGGPQALAGLNGRYVVVVWDEARNQVVVVNDELGMQRLCWARSNGVFLFSTHYLAFGPWEGLRGRLDDEAVAQVFGCGYPMGERTILADVRLAPPGSIGTIKPGEVRWSAYGSLLETPAADMSDIDACADRLGATLDGVLREYASGLGGRLVIPLSGGMDSRTVLGFARRAGIEGIYSCSYGHRHTYDVRFGRQLASIGGTKHKYIKLRQSYVEDFLELDGYITEGESPAHSFHTSILRDFLRPGDVLWSGFLGDKLSGSRVPCYSAIVDRDARFEWYFRRRYAVWPDIADSEWNRIIMPDFREAFRTGPRAAVREELEKIDVETFEQAALRAEITQRQRRFTVQQLEMLNPYCEAVAPFCDRRVVKEFLSLPVNALLGQRAYCQMLVKFCPEMARVPWDRTMQPVSGEGSLNGEGLTELRGRSGSSLRIPAWLGWRVDRHLGRKNRRQRYSSLLASASLGWLGNHDRKAYAHYDSVIASHAPSLTGLLEEESLLLPYFNPAGIRDLLSKPLTESQTFTIFNVLTFAYWRRKIEENFR